MKPKVPNSPFFMCLSGSAKETELRIRNIFQWKKKRPPIILILLAFLLVAGCGSLVEFTTPSAQPVLDAESGAPSLVADAGSPDVASAMARVTADDLSDSSLFVRKATNDEIARALNAAVEHEIDEEVVLSAGYTKPGTFPFWSDDVYYDAESGTVTPYDPHFSIACGLAENIVEVSLYEDGQWGTAYFEDEGLYQLIRRGADSE